MFGLTISGLATSLKLVIGFGSINDVIINFFVNILIYTCLCALLIVIWNKSWGKPVLVVFVILAILFGIPFYFNNQATTPIVPTATNTEQMVNTATYIPIRQPTATLIPKATATPSLYGLLPFHHEQTSYTQSEYTNSKEILEHIDFQARNLAIARPFKWQYYELETHIRYQDIYDYYYSTLSLQNYRISFNQEGDNGITLLKFINGEQRVTVQFWPKSSSYPPTVLVIYEGW